MFLRTLLLTVLISVACAAPGAAQFFSDDFDDGVISAAYWSSIGMNTESGGYLNLNRGTANQEDFIETVDTFDGNWVVEFDMRLNEIGWGDRFHGVSIVGANGQGITFGYSVYGQLFLAVHDGASGTGYYYGVTGSNQLGAWLHARITRHNGQMEILVDGLPVLETGAANAIVPDGVTFRLPGYFQGENGQSGTSSDIDDFSITAGQVPVLSSSWSQVKSSYQESN